MDRRRLFRLDEIGRTRIVPQSIRPVMPRSDHADATTREAGNEAMGFKRYKGPVKDLLQAMAADMPVRITCTSCGRERQMHAFKVVQLLREKRKISNVPLGEPVIGFKCNYEKRSVMVTITAPSNVAW